MHRRMNDLSAYKFYKKGKKKKIKNIEKLKIKNDLICGQYTKDCKLGPH
jgi:hypothetical protein